MPTQNELNSLFGGPLSHNVKEAGHSFSHTGPLSIIVAFGFRIMGFLCVQMCTHLHLYAFLSFFFGSFSWLIVLLYSDLFVFYFTVFYYYSLDACLFSNERQKWGIWMERGVG